MPFDFIVVGGGGGGWGGVCWGFFTDWRKLNFCKHDGMKKRSIFGG